jgi:hypothetical protein
VHAHAVVHPIGSGFTRWGVGGDDEHFVTRTTEVLHHPKHRVGDAVDIREETLCDDRNAHTKRVTSRTVEKVACGDTTRKVLVRKATNIAIAVQVFCAPRKGD